MSYEEKLIDIITSMIINFSSFNELSEHSKNKVLIAWKKLAMFELDGLKARIISSGEKTVLETVGHETPLVFSMEGLPQLPEGSTVVIEGFRVNTNVLPINKPVSAFYTNIDILFQEDKNAA